MTARFAILAILFSLAAIVSAVILALALWVAPQVGLPSGPWAVPIATLIGFLGVFLPVRRYVLPLRLSAPAWKATAILVLWIGATLVMWQATMWVVRPVMQSAGFERGTFAILLACLLATWLVIERTLGAGRVPR